MIVGGSTGLQCRGANTEFSVDSNISWLLKAVLFDGLRAYRV
jgi:hypothetical protein